jgi:hypothetical protein
MLAGARRAAEIVNSGGQLAQTSDLTNRSLADSSKIQKKKIQENRIHFISVLFLNHWGTAPSFTIGGNRA